MKKAKKATKKGISLGAAFALAFLLAAPASAEARGAKLHILKKDGAAVEGELIAVKGRTLILVEDSTQLDVSLQLEEASRIIIKRKSEDLLGSIIGGAVASAATSRDRGGFFGSTHFAKDGTVIDDFALGADVGSFIGAALSQVEKFVVVDMTQEAQDKLLVKLRSKSRFPKER